MRLHIDFETASDLDLKKVGVYRYAEHPSTIIRCMAWGIDDLSPALWTPDFAMSDPLIEAIQRRKPFLQTFL